MPQNQVIASARKAKVSAESRASFLFFAPIVSTAIAPTSGTMSGMRWAERCSSHPAPDQQHNQHRERNTDQPQIVLRATILQSRK